ncbi:tyrosine-tyramine antiporter [Limosilactobacillus mucosae]|uniref:Tyrosine-tyramine antiporter n=3 Tax=Bacteria TaxID=2 RepID=A0AAJ1HQP9_LIMMU|nr:tyrosine-tyramine antiporter [Limosilactobacillus mucosae]MDC2828832.1 tyrosine-tyramine antiporter [Limosilactobacillus mucosae]MDC2836686.1 tyrosine-tyramine antiporter [Limosilactobacillus mucosae]MDC2848866.1 tyrosine-tyramine antiporter [Limosilactobacillus mucosae]MDC2854418.1 tyrosine-tyramine antiporter [Limosilactobacillus mucosae]MDE8676787.1 tyrosine-tyramine antiporter [Limosilactobacillus mucosae]
MSESNKISLGTFVGIGMAMIATVRSVPTLAAASWQMFFYMAFAVIFFALPVSIMSGEFSAMFNDAGGPQLWVREGINQKWGFTTAWLLWVQIFPGMVMVASTLGPLLGNTIGNVALGQNHWFTLACIIVIYWIITVLNLKFDMVKFAGNFGVWFGVYIPFAIMIIMGVAASVKSGIAVHSVLGSFSVHKLLPDASTLQYVAAISFIFTGIETLGVYVPRMKDASHDFVRGVIFALVAMVILNLLNAFCVANVVPAGSTQLTNITQPVILFCKILGWPTWIANVFSLLAAVGVFLQLSGWVTGPSQSMVQVAREGLLPSKWGFFKHNNIGVARNVVLTQSTCITLFALMYALPDINSVFLLLTNTTTILYCIIYFLIAIAFIRLRYTKPDMPRPYRVGKSGNGAAWVWTILFIFGIVSIAIVTLYAAGAMNALFMVIVGAVLTIIPLVINSHKNEQWLKDAKAYEESQK